MSKILKVLGALVLLSVLFVAGLLIYVEVNQQALIKQLKAKLDKNIKGELNIGKIQLSILKDFPRLALTIKDLSVKDSVYKKEIFQADKIYLRMSLMQLFRKQLDFSKVSLDGGRFYLVRDTNGYLNSDILRYKSEGGANLGFDVKEIDVRNLEFIQHDNILGQHMSFTVVRLAGKVPSGDLAPVMHLSGEMRIDSMVFKADKGAFFKNKTAGLEVNMSIDNEKKRLIIHPSKFEMDKQFYDGKGFFDFGTPPGILSLEFSNPKTDFKAARGILSDVIQGYMKGIEVQDSVDVKVVVFGPVVPGFPPQVDAYFNMTDARMSFSGIHFTGLNLKGQFTNHVAAGVKNDDANSAIKFDVPSVQIEGVPISANVTITDLLALRIALTAASQTPLTAINRVLPPGGYKFTGGDLDLSLSYNGILSNYVAATQKKGEDTLSGFLKIKDGGFTYAVREIKLTGINTDIAFDQLKMEIKDLSASLNGNQVSVKGYLDGVSRLISNKNQKMVGNLTLDAPKFNLSSVLTEKSLSQISAMPKDTTGAGGKAATDAIDQLIDDVTLRLNFNSNLFTFRKFVAQKVKGEATISTRGMELKNFNLNTCKGTITVNGGLQTGRSSDKISGIVQVKNVNVKEFLVSADNFNQQAITSDNLNGNLSAYVNFSAPLDTGYTPRTDSMQGDIYFSLKDGKITDFAPLADIGKSIFKNRDFKNVTFDEIKDTVSLSGMNLTIRRMEIASNIFRMFVQGRYQINGAADVTIQVPLSNLKKQDINYTPANIGVDAKTGASIFLRLRGGGKEKIKVSLDAGAKQRLKKEGLM